MTHFSRALGVLALGTAAFSSVSYAAPSYYVGLQGGYSQASVKGTYAHLFSQDPNAVGHADFSHEKTLKKGGFSGGLILGADYLLNPQNALGLQISAEFGSNKVSHEVSYPAIYSNPYKVDIAQSYAITPALKFTYFVNPQFNVFLSLGCSMSSFKATLKPEPDARNESKTAFKVGFSPSIGAGYNLSPRITLFGTVGLDSYGKTKIQFSKYDTEPAQIHPSESITPSYISGKIGVLYRFG